ncbi:MAG: DNA methyltransferase [Caldilineales bacterium]|nr:DNA methyltransferase [Caldilineales bacterium]MDW8317301.1 DNA methyltransferase [Anaerolineae bacterium]
MTIPVLGLQASIANKALQSAEQEPSLERIATLDRLLEEYFQSKFVVHASLSRQLVSFQANKARPIYRWYKFKEGFSAGLVEFLLAKYPPNGNRILDPFAGSGTTLFVASELGFDADGIELLPIGQQIIKTKLTIDSHLVENDLVLLRRWVEDGQWRFSERRLPLPELRITKGAYSERTRELIERYLAAIQHEPPVLQTILRFALLCVLEDVSYTRKDGQYLRWDYRSGRKQGKKPFNKGEIFDFEAAITQKLRQIIEDLTPSPLQPSLFSNGQHQRGQIFLFSGSCLDILPQLPAGHYSAIITSPPYCNRYDYTRTYALELAMLGVGERELWELRQNMLSCTVENRSKDLLSMNPAWRTAIDAADNQELLQAILAYLDDQRVIGALNNNGIPRMVRGYFYEMACVIAEAARVLKPGAPFMMVNDNVRYAGASISVDMILSALAESLGFNVENILVLPSGKGNSSQQMGQHGREPLRKCVYVWRRR